MISIFFKHVLLNQKIQFRFPNWIKKDHEPQLYTGLVICFGFALISEKLSLSAALGAMLGGMLISKSDALQWFEKNLTPFRIFFISLFFISIGLQINLDFFLKHLSIISILILIVMLVNSAINVIAFRIMKVNWRDSMYAGALLSQIGEFSLVFCIVAKNQNIVGEYWYQLTLAVIAGTMLMSSIWINIIRNFIYIPKVATRLYKKP
jgi:CPA2 family monovalent cation:H+ antiporter-2